MFDNSECYGPKLGFLVCRITIKYHLTMTCEWAMRDSNPRHPACTERQRRVRLLQRYPQFDICSGLILLSDAANTRSGSRSVVRAFMAV
jgi:hypothetical protein